jgi:lipoprotein-anchoring transpeptidase ErfK/SrfK
MPRVNLKLDRTTGLGTLECVGGSTLKCGGQPGFAYPADTTIQATDKKGDVYSREYVNAAGQPALMKYSILWIGQRGVYFHSYPTLSGSHGCIHLLEDDAITFYNWVTGRTRIVFQWTG